MVRKNDTRRLFEEEEITKYFSLVDNSPEIIISSIELKVDLPNRSSILAALAETAINGSWANEKWLVCFQLTGAAEFDEDAINFANDNGIGIILVRLEMEQGKQSKFEVAKTLVAKTRPTLRINNEIVGKGELFPTMKRLLMAISNSDEGTFLDQDDDLLKMITLLCEARDNLVIQSYFKGPPLRDSFSTLKELNSEVFSETCNSTYRALLEAVGQTKIEKYKIDAAARSIEVQMKEEFVEILGLLQEHSK